MNSRTYGTNYQNYLARLMDALLLHEKTLLAEGRLIKKYQDVRFSDPASCIRIPELMMDVIHQSARITLLRREDISCDYTEEMKKLYDKLIILITVCDMPMDFLFDDMRMWDLKAIFETVKDNRLEAEQHAWNITEALMTSLLHLRDGDHMLYYYLELAHFSFIEWCVMEDVKPVVLLV